MDEGGMSPWNAATTRMLANASPRAFKEILPRETDEERAPSPPPRLVGTAPPAVGSRQPIAAGGSACARHKIPDREQAQHYSYNSTASTGATLTPSTDTSTKQEFGSAQLAIAQIAHSPVLCYSTSMEEGAQHQQRRRPPLFDMHHYDDNDDNNNKDNDNMTTAASTVLATNGSKGLPPQDASPPRKDSSPTLTCIEPSPPGPPPDKGTAAVSTTQQQQQSPQQQHQHHQHSGKSQKRRSIGDWDFVKTIGAGSMGQVKLAKHRYTEALCAVKVIPRASHKSSQNANSTSTKQKESDESKDIRSIREASICKLLHHRFICEMYEMYTMNHHFYMLFEFVSGGQLLDYIIAHGSLKEKQARKFARSIASALDYLHRNSIVHRDLKIENILISKSGDIKLIDFGLSNLYAPNSLLKTFCGSLYFAAPELLNAHPYIGPEVDVWSFGIVLYVLVCGKVPFDDQSMAALHAKIKRGKVEYPDELSSDCVDLLSRMLVVNPQERAPLSEILHHPWLNKGYDRPPDSYVPFRRPLSLPLDPAVTKEMAGFEFGSQEDIEASLTSILESPEYIQASSNWYNLHHHSQDSSFESTNSSNNNQGGSPKKRPFNFDFYKRKSYNDHHQDSGSATTLNPDPTSGYHPLVSIYYLVQEKFERDRQKSQAEAEARAQKHQILQQGPPITPQKVEIEIPQLSKPDPAAPRIPTRARAKTQGTADYAQLSTTPQQQTSQPQQQAIVTPTTYAPPAQTRQNYHGYHQSHVSEPPASATARQQASNLASSLLRKFSTKNKRPPSTSSREQQDMPPVVLEQKQDEVQYDRPPASPTRRVQKEHLNRSTSMSEGGATPRQYRRTAGAQPPPPPLPADFKYPAPNTTTTTSPTKSRMAPQQQQPQRSPSQQQRKYHPSARAKSLGHTAAMRREQPPALLEPTPQLEDVFDDVALDTPPSSESSSNGLGVGTGAGSSSATQSGMPSIEYPKQVFLKGFFSVQSTSTKPLAFIRSDIIRVLKHLGVEFKEIKGGFMCVHRPSIKPSPHSSSLHPDDEAHQALLTSPPMSPQGPSSGGGGHWRKLSFGSGLFAGSGRNKRGTESSGNILDSDVSAESVGGAGSTPAAGGSDMLGANGTAGSASVRTPLRFEIYIVKVPILSLHGVQFKKLTGNSWQYKSLATKILSELRL